MFTYPFHLNCYDAIKTYTLEYMNKFNQRDIYAETVVLPFEVQHSLKNELKHYGLNGISNCLAFKRKNYFKPRLETVHIDTGIDGDVVYSSIVLPIEGCNNTDMFWMQGEYITQKSFLANGTAYQEIEWNTEPTLVNQYEIIEPTLCRVDIPHDALSNINGEYRTILSIRLQGNPKFEDVIKQRFNVAI